MHLARNDDGNLLVIDRQGVMFILDGEQWLQFDEQNLTITDTTQIQSRYDGEQFLVMLTNKQINTINVTFIIGKSARDSHLVPRIYL